MNILRVIPSLINLFTTNFPSYAVGWPAGGLEILDGFRTMLPG